MAHIEEREPSTTAAARDGFVNRAGELATITAAIRAAGGGVPRALFLAGEAGIGKTRLLEQASRWARQQGVDVLWAHGSEIAATIPFACWRELLRAYAALHGGSVLAGLLGHDRATLEPIMPFGSRETTSAGTPRQRDSAHRDRLFVAGTQLLRRIATAQPLVVIIDDVHLVDIDSLQLLRFMVGATPGPAMLVLAAYRDTDVTEEHPAAAALRALEQEPHSERVLIDRLADADAARLLDGLAGATLSEPVRDIALRQAGGNPLFLSEAWRYLVNQGVVRHETTGWTIHGDPETLEVPAGIRTVLARRLAQLSEETQQVLRVAALLGSDITPLHVAQVHGDADATRRALHEATAARVVSAAANESHSTFSHPLLREHLVQQLPELDRRRLHQRIATFLEAQADLQGQLPLAEIAHHWVLGADEQRAEHAIDYAERAGHEAFQVLGFAEAARWFDRGLRLMQRYRPEHAQRAIHLLMSLGEALAYAGDEAAARATFRAAAARPLAEQSREHATVPAADQPLEIERLLSAMRLGIESPANQREEQLQQERKELQAVASATVERARRVGNLAALASALVHSRWLLSTSARPVERLAISSEAVLLAEAVEAPHLALEAGLLRIQDLLETGGIVEAEAAITKYGEDSGRWNLPIYHWFATYMQATVHALHGRLAPAEALAQEALIKGGMSIGDVGLAICLSQIIGARAYQGRMGEMVVLLEAFVEQHPGHPIGHGNLASVYCELNRFDEARREVQRATELALRPSLFRDTFISYTAASLARPCVHLSDAPRSTVL